jgi:TonB family protein
MSTHVAKEYVPTIINSRPLLPRLATELKALEQECRLAWPYFKQHPVHATLRLVRTTFKKSVRVLLAPNVLAALSTVSMIVLSVLVFERTHQTFGGTDDSAETPPISELTIINFKELDKKLEDSSIGRNGNGRVGFQENKSGEGSGEIRRQAQGGGGGGEHEPEPQQAGKLPPPSDTLAAIPKTPPVYPPVLPVAGMDVDPALWKDLKAPVYGDPRSTSDVSSKGPGNGGGMGTNNGLGIGEGDGGGYGPGSKGNMGGNDKQTGCCGGSRGEGNGVYSDQRPLRGSEVEQRARLLFKPEPQYTEEARRNQITGTVMLRVVFSSSGQVEQIRAVQTLPFGLTERAIAAARQIKFVPATKSGHSVSVYMQLEYNFNLY